MKKRPMVIGYDASRAFIKDRTGTENYSFQLLKSLIKIDKKNRYVIYLRANFDQSSKEALIKELEITGTNPRKIPETNRIKWHVIKDYRLWTQKGLATQTFKEKLDVLFIPAHTLPIFRQPGLKTVVTVHDLGSEFLPKMHQLKQRLYLSFMQKLQLRGATKIIAVSNATKDDLVQKIGLSPSKISVVYEGYDQNLFKPVKGDTLKNRLKQWDIVPSSYFLFVGTVQPRKNLERLIRAFDRILRLETRNLKLDIEARSSNLDTNFNLQGQTSNFQSLTSNLKLVIVGSKGWLSDEIYALPKKLGIEDRVKFLGRVEDHDLPYIYSGAISLVFPSLFEGFGLPIIEAQACGVPVITSNTSSMPEIVGDSAILVDPYDIESIYSAMVKITTNHELTYQLTNKGFENIKRFSWEKAASDTLKILEAI